MRSGGRVANLYLVWSCTRSSFLPGYLNFSCFVMQCRSKASIFGVTCMFGRKLDRSMIDLPGIFMVRVLRSSDRLHVDGVPSMRENWPSGRRVIRWAISSMLSLRKSITSGLCVWMC